MSFSLYNNVNQNKGINKTSNILENDSIVVKTVIFWDVETTFDTIIRHKFSDNAITDYSMKKFSADTDPDITYYNPASFTQNINSNHPVAISHIDASGSKAKVYYIYNGGPRIWRGERPPVPITNAEITVNIKASFKKKEKLFYKEYNQESKLKHIFNIIFKITNLYHFKKILAGNIILR